MSTNIHYPDFVALAGFEGQTDDQGCFDWYGDWRVCPAGVFLATAPYGMFLSAQERDALPRHPTGDYNQPILAFPCGPDALIAMLAEHGLSDCIDLDRLNQWMPDRATASDAALGAAYRAQMSGIAKGNQAMSDARKLEWDRWKAKADEIQAARGRPASKRELGELVRAALGLSESPDTIRHRI